ncbi:Uncharacterised protein [Mycobacteroides abscessus subsp. abscessus]|nr:Uncharacterised protein [Mycobacteroides abscessus subsp. abscessus]
MSTPPTCVSRLAVRWKQLTGVAQRTISSTAVAGRSFLNNSHWSGCSRKAFMPWLIALRVVSLPATVSRMKKNPNSASSRCCPSISALTSVLTMSSTGHFRRSSAML